MMTRLMNMAIPEKSAISVWTDARFRKWSFIILIMSFIK